MAHYFSMGGYAAFVWPAYAVSLLGIGGLFWITLKDYARAKERLRKIESDDHA
jgi:heme exporter protein D